MNLVFDLDGTICFQGRPISEPIMEQLQMLGSAGHQVIFASARPIRDMLPVIPALMQHFPLIGGNGSLISQHGQITHAFPFDDDQVTRLFALFQEFQATYLADSDWDYTYTGPAHHPILEKVDSAKLATNKPITELRPILKALVLTAKNMNKLAEQLANLDVVIHRHHQENVIDISPKHIDKWYALQQLGLQSSEFIAFGNDANDITLFKHAKHAIMIGQHPELTPFATEALPYDQHVEQAIIHKLRELLAQTVE